MDKDCSCGNCCLWWPFKDSKNGQCHRYPPKESHTFITTHQDDFCGEHRPGTLKAAKEQPKMGGFN